MHDMGSAPKQSSCYKLQQHVHKVNVTFSGLPIHVPLSPIIEAIRRQHDRRRAKSGAVLHLFHCRLPGREPAVLLRQVGLQPAAELGAGLLHRCDTAL